MKRVARYGRVSTEDQTTENQLLDLRRCARKRGWHIRGAYLDEGVSGVEESRPQLDRLMDLVRKRRGDVVLVWRFDRFARRVRHRVSALDEMRGLGVDFVSYQENVDTSSALGHAIFVIIGPWRLLNGTSSSNA